MRNHIYKSLLIFSFFLFYFNLCDAQKIWTLEDCITYAKKNNLNIKQQELNVKISEYNQFQSYASLLPSINGYASHQYNYGLTVDRYTNQFAKNKVQSDNLYLSGSLTLFNGLQLQNTIRKNNVDLQTSKYDANKLINDISLNIANAYLHILFDDEILKTTQDQLDIDKQQVDKNKKMYEAGTIAKGTLLSIEAQAAADELLVVNAQNTLDLSYLALKQLLDLPAGEAFLINKPRIEITGEELLKQKAEDIYSSALTSQPDIKSAELKLRSSDINLAIARGMRSPQITLQGNIGTGYSGASMGIVGNRTFTEPIGYTLPDSVPVFSKLNSPIYDKIPFRNQINDNVNKVIGVSLSLPILNGFQTYTTINKSKIAVKNAEYNLQITKNNLNKTIQQAFADAKAAFNKYFSTKKSMEAIEESYKYAKEKYDVGMLSFVDYNDAQTKSTKAKSDLLQAKYDYIFRIKVLDFYQGKPLFFK